MSARLEQLRAMLERIDDWPTIDGRPNTPYLLSQVIIASHKLTDDVIRPLIEVAEAAELIRAYDQAGGNEWWEAHAKLYAALEKVAPR